MPSAFSRERTNGAGRVGVVTGARTSFASNGNKGLDAKVCDTKRERQTASKTIGVLTRDAAARAQQTMTAVTTRRVADNVADDNVMLATP